MDITDLVFGTGVVECCITPDLARHILTKHNKKNRSLVSTVVRKYASDMKRGAWIQNEQNKWIAFYTDGNLADGQHRLASIIESGCPYLMRVERGLTSEHAYGIDAHRMRRATDQIRIHGGNDWITGSDVAIARMLYEVQNKLSGSGVSLPPSLLTDICNTYKERLEFVKSAMPSSKKYISTTPVRLAVLIASGFEDHEKLRRFCKVLDSGLSESQQELAAIRLRERLLRDGRAFNSGGGGRAMALRFSMRAIKAFCAGTALKSLVDPVSMPYDPSGV